MTTDNVTQFTKVNETLKSIASEFIVFASDQTTAKTMSRLVAEGISFKVLLGSYKGEKETSFMITIKDVSPIVGLIKDQESILSLSNRQKDGSREAQLVFVNTGESKSIGMFNEITEEQANSQDSWSFDPTLNQYFGAK